MPAKYKAPIWASDEEDDAPQTMEELDRELKRFEKPKKAPPKFKQIVPKHPFTGKRMEFDAGFIDPDDKESSEWVFSQVLRQRAKDKAKEEKERLGLMSKNRRDKRDMMPLVEENKRIPVPETPDMMLRKNVPLVKGRISARERERERSASTTPAPAQRNLQNNRNHQPTPPPDDYDSDPDSLFVRQDPPSPRPRHMKSPESLPSRANTPPSTASATTTAPPRKAVVVPQQPPRKSSQLFGQLKRTDSIPLHLKKSQQQPTPPTSPRILPQARPSPPKAATPRQTAAPLLNKPTPGVQKETGRGGSKAGKPSKMAMAKRGDTLMKTASKFNKARI